MIDKEILGGVTPLKAKRQSSRGGRKAGKATSTGKRRGGFAKSKGRKGGGGRNVGGYNAQTRFKADKWKKPPSGGGGGGGTPAPSPAKPYSYGPNGDIIINNVNQNAGGGPTTTTTPGTPGSPEEGYTKSTYKDETTSEGGLESYKSVWDKNDNDLQGKYEGNYDNWVKAAEDWWKNDATDEQKKSRNKSSKTTRERTDEYVKTKDAVEGTAGSSTTTYGGTGSNTSNITNK